jgi:hypothetical protein
MDARQAALVATAALLLTACGQSGKAPAGESPTAPIATTEVATEVTPDAATPVAAVPGDGDSQGDATVAGTSYNATADLVCGGQRPSPTGRCKAGVSRGTGPDGSSSIDVRWPDGGTRALFFNADGSFLAASGNEADGSAGYATSSERRGDTTIITFGPERYEVPDAFLKGD